MDRDNVTFIPLTGNTAGGYPKNLNKCVLSSD